MSKHTASKQPRFSTRDDEWIRKHFQQLVDTYPGQYVVVANGDLFVGHDAGKLFAEARSKHPNIVPTGMPIPRPKDFSCVL